MSATGAGAWDGSSVEVLARRWGVPLVEAHRRLGSTSDRALQLAAGGAPDWSVVVADEQTRGRGRRGSAWISPSGAGLWMSLLAPAGGSADTALPLRVGLACAEAVEALLPGVDVGLKWPNDLVVSGGKVGGILCEAEDARVVVGIGINVSEAPDPGRDREAHGPDGSLTLPPAALEIVSGKSLQRSELAGAILGRLRERLGSGIGGDGALDRATAEQFRRRDVLSGATVHTEQEGSGRAEGIDPSGALLLLRPDGSRVRVVSGGVRFISADRPASVPDRV